MPDTTDLEALITRLVNDRTLLRSGEAGTRMGAVNPTLRALGWDTDNLDEVDPEFADGGGGKVDYCLRHQGRNLVLIEAKRASEELANHQGQLLQYAFGLGVELAALTNGLDWWLYLPMKGGRSFERRRFALVSFRDQGAAHAAMMLERFLSRDACVGGATLRAAEDEFARQERAQQTRTMLPEAWSRVLTDPRLHDLLAREVEQIAGHRPEPELIADFLSDLPGTGARVAPVGPPQPRQPAPSSPSNEVTKKPAPSGPPTPPTELNRSDFSGSRPTGFWLDGTLHEVASWRVLLQRVCVLLRDQTGPTVFGERVAGLRGRRRPYFSASPSDLREALPISGTGLFVEGNQSANSAVRVARLTLQTVRGSDEGFDIEVAE